MQVYVSLRVYVAFLNFWYIWYMMIHCDEAGEICEMWWGPPERAPLAISESRGLVIDALSEDLGDRAATKKRFSGVKKDITLVLMDI